MSRRPSLALALLACGALAAAAHADLLVTRDGATIETAGPWKVEGRMVVFTLPGGALSSIRSDQVDLDRSAAATRRAVEAAAMPAPPPESAKPLGEPIFRITDKDVQAVASGEEVEGELGTADEGHGREGRAVEEGAASGPLEVISWDQLDLPDGDGVEVFGTLRNNGRESVVSPGVTAYVYGEGGGLLATSDGTVNLSTIPPGKTANFRAPFPGLHDFVAIKFDLVGRGYRVRGSTIEGGEDDESGYPGSAGGEEGLEEESIDEGEVDPGAKYDAAYEPPAEPEEEDLEETPYPEDDEAEEPPPAA